ncbi:2-amino-4-hydroxy-6-hydroxymethyldihydropteridine diphosphokinase [Luteolibacter ambystomatis]|uniref:2-amino-4-hydroxy-6-hydroxymethyldihydropteridine pyrophosphokinase n=1 Tax=Luteolibacter ambystomatis TaxID=2824561 RepID=A0A975G4Z1_9BACT|nr:2-amino-4-hydroxy-6-hydroxymethyldihydropteridine diphosphokinase [Luteolibacter ambystomatis]QUE49429.1 2-amino-4-hydroxy-6-hydroxymethyldihydropteridine diphosphokinase [Luteolibacter ambystomatis]
MKPSVSQRVGIALGSNLGRKLAHLQIARDLLKNIAVPGALFRQAPIYQTEPVHCPDGSPDFFNTVVEFAFTGTPFDLLGHTQAIEFKLGREATPERNAPRIIDVDILYFGSEEIDAGLLVLPHPRLTSRRFVLQPLADIRPELVLPGDQVTIAEHLQHLDSAEAPLALVQAHW